MAAAIKVENLSKIYRLGEIGTGTISRDIERFVKTKILKQEDPYLKIGETNDRATRGASDIVYSLKDINFEIEQGDAVGIIGRNGAGKSTLLKILSRVTSPTTGKINIKGRVASLLEVGTGFHPELTGRENIYLNGAILGMRKREIDRKLDEIIDFSGVERYIDTPVKRYSSGMYVRLAFAVAAHLESEILIVDEVLAVGDAEFQKKCLGKMGEVSKGEGRTVLFVSHNMGAMNNLCNKGLVLNSGKNIFSGNIDDAIQYYTGISLDSMKNEAEHKILSGIAIISNYKFSLEEKEMPSGSSFPMGKNLEIMIEIYAKEEIKSFSIAIDIKNVQGELISHLTNEDDNFYIETFHKNEKKRIIIKTDKINFAPGIYFFDLWIGSSHIDGIYIIRNAFNFFVEQSEIVKRIRPLPVQMKYFLNSNWNDSSW